MVIAGGGVAGLEALLALRHQAEDRVEIEVLAPERDFTYRPLAVAEPFGRGQALRFDLASLVADLGARHRADALTSVDPDHRLARTRAGDEVAYDALLVACGAASREAIPGAFTFWGTAGGGGLAELLGELERAGTAELVFALPAGAGWPLPLYELALLTRSYLDTRGADGVRTAVVTHEDSPLEIFGADASETVASLLERRGIGLCTGCRAAAAVEREGLSLIPAGRIAADRVVALPRLEARRIGGLPRDEDGFLPTDEHGRVRGVDGVFAAGDGTSFPYKQGGIAAQQADAVAEWIAARAGAPVTPRPFRPVLRGLLLTGGEPTFLRAELDGGDETSAAAPHALWWPPGKIAGKYLAPHLAALASR